MCTFVIVEQGNDVFECTNHGELIEALGCAPIYRHPACELRSPNDCLCQFDAEATAKKYGYTYDPENSSFGDVTLHRKAA